MQRNIAFIDASLRFGELWMKLGFFGWCCLILCLPSHAQHQRASAWLSEADFVSIAGRCAPGAPPDTLLAIARTESGLYANAISVNRPRSSAKYAGYRDAEIILSRQPRNKMEAAQWVRWLAAHHLTVSIGLMQVNAETASRFSVTVDQLFDPCTNLRVGAAILIAAYSHLARDMGEGFAALDAALSLYNTGNSIAGFRNGYVASVYAHASRATTPSSKLWPSNSPLAGVLPENAECALTMKTTPAEQPAPTSMRRRRFSDGTRELLH